MAIDMTPVHHSGVADRSPLARSRHRRLCWPDHEECLQGGVDLLCL